MPGLIHEQTDEDKKIYLKNLYDEIILKISLKEIK